MRLFTAVFITVYLIILTVIHKLLLRRHAASILTSMIALPAIEGLLLVMNSARLTIYITWFLIPLMSLQFRDFRLYFLSVAANYGFMVFATWQIAGYFY